MLLKNGMKEKVKFPQTHILLNMNIIEICHKRNIFCFYAYSVIY